MVRKLSLGILVSAIFIYFTLRGVDFHQVWMGLKGKHFIMLLPVVATFVACQIAKSLRWGVILSPVKTINQQRLFPIASVGYMAIIALPMRIGEVVRPYLLSTKEHVPMGTGFATVFVERVLDLAVLLLFFFLVLARTNLPAPIARAGIVLLALIIAELCAIVGLALWPHAVLLLLAPLKRYMPKIGHRAEVFTGNLAAGFKIISSGRKLAQSIALSLAVWGLSALAVFFLFSFCNLHFGLTEALGVTSITALGISLPAAPGLIGNFQFACIAALSIWGVGKTEAFTYAMAYYVMGIGINLLLGVLCMPVVDIRLRNVLKADNRAAADERLGDSALSNG